MDRDAFIGQLQEIVEEYLRNRGFEPVEFICRREGRNLILRILADRPEGGINLDDCAFLNNELGVLLEEKDLIKESYVLEVSSPGLDRPLKTKNDFSRCKSKRARFFFNEQINGKFEFEGLINKVEGDSVYIEADGAIVDVALSKITKAKQVI